MSGTAKHIGLAAAMAFTFAAALPAAAQVEIEADPIAYAFNGFSLHAAKVLGSMRVNIGTFGLDVPEAYHGNAGWTSTMRGAGVKVDWLGASIDGFFAGVEGGYMRVDYARAGIAGRVTRDVVGGGVRGGYRQPIGRSGLYVAPWVGVGYNFDGDAVRIGADEFERAAISIFPTVHIGWRF